jgi:uncharacterized protein DUF6660
MVRILSVYILFTAVVPCSIFDKCDGARDLEQHSKNEQKKDCNDCCPFCVCSTAHNFNLSNGHNALEPFIVATPVTYGRPYPSFISEYFSSFFQPPRIG